MKIMFASDIHGSAYYCGKMLQAYGEEKASRLILLGDVLYHGPRNDLPRDYSPKSVTKMLNERKQEIYAVRGNCDSEVDQTMLEFPIMADYAVVLLEKHAIYATHGHIYNKDNLPPMQRDDILIHGHTHLYTAHRGEEYVLINPGSVSLPKENNIPTYGILEDHIFTIKGFNNEIVKVLDLG